MDAIRLDLATTLPFFAGEDFALLLKQTPGAMFFLGVANAVRGIAGIPHLPDHADERAILVFLTRSFPHAISVLEGLVAWGKKNFGWVAFCCQDWGALAPMTVLGIQGKIASKRSDKLNKPLVARVVARPA